MEKRKILLYIVVAIFLCSCELDNYTEPDVLLEGVVVDALTGENIQTRQPDGIKIRLLENGYESPEPIDFWAKADGSFRNARLFAGRYTVTAIEGPFAQSSVQELIVDLPINQSIEIPVIPFVRIKNVDISSSNGKIIAKYQIEKTSATGNLIKSMLICDKSVILHQTTSGKLSSVENNLSNMTDEVISSTLFNDEITGLTPGTTYYTRVAVLNENNFNRFNYSPIVKIVVK